MCCVHISRDAREGPPESDKRRGAVWQDIDEAHIDAGKEPIA